eukprot:Mycagemm_TRINITY_DN10287_c1_g5::TRINITY_DN10287_c1_g5_i1::g.3701::m.3701 type:complete len:101 gc:universal TRINITY_DN10287_c1_g5_i1:402-704(+)
MVVRSIHVETNSDGGTLAGEVHVSGSLVLERDEALATEPKLDVRKRWLNVGSSEDELATDFGGAGAVNVDIHVVLDGHVQLIREEVGEVESHVLEARTLR